MLGFSDREPGDWPHKLSCEDITAAFADDWRIDSIAPARIEARLDTGSVLPGWPPSPATEPPQPDPAPCGSS